MARGFFVALVLVLAAWQPAEAQSPASSDAGATRLLVGPTARALEQGRLYVDFSGFVGGPFAQVGVTDRISVGAGMPVLIPGVRPGDALVVTPKVQVLSHGTIDAAVGVLHVTGRRVQQAGIAYGVVTRGRPGGAVTAGLGVTYGGATRMTDSASSVVMLSGEKRLTSRVTVISENYAGFGGGLLCGGIRLVRRRSSLDLGVATLVGTEYRIVAPVFRFAWSL